MSDRFKQLWPLANSVHGWLKRNEGRALYELARARHATEAIVEIGTWEGKSTICLAAGSADGNRPTVVTIDPHTFGSDFERLTQNIRDAGMTNVVKPIIGFSTAVATTFEQPVGLLFIDGAHRFDAVKGDYDAWIGKVVARGTVAVHDTILWPGPRRLVDEVLFKSRSFRRVHLVGSLTIAEKVDSNTVFDRLWNRARLLHKRLKVVYTFAEWRIRDPDGLRKELELHRTWG